MCTLVALGVNITKLYGRRASGGSEQQREGAGFLKVAALYLFGCRKAH